MIKDKSNNRYRFSLSSKPYHLLIPIGIMEFLGSDYAMKTPNRYSRIMALMDLADRYYQSIEMDGALSSTAANLCRSWHWSRPTVYEFLNRLSEQGIITVKNICNVKRVFFNGAYLQETE